MRDLTCDICCFIFCHVLISCFISCCARLVAYICSITFSLSCYIFCSIVPSLTHLATYFIPMSMRFYILLHILPRCISHFMYCSIFAPLHIKLHIYAPNIYHALKLIPRPATSYLFLTSRMIKSFFVRYRRLPVVLF